MPLADSRAVIAGAPARTLRLRIAAAPRTCVNLASSGINCEYRRNADWCCADRVAIAQSVAALIYCIDLLPILLWRPTAGAAVSGIEAAWPGCAQNLYYCNY